MQVCYYAVITLTIQRERSIVMIARWLPINSMPRPKGTTASLAADTASQENR